MTQADNEPGPFAKIFGVIGFIAGLASGAETEMGGGGIFILALFMAGVGLVIGNFVDKLIARVIFILVSLFMILVNSAIRSFIWGIIQGIAGS